MCSRRQFTKFPRCFVLAAISGLTLLSVLLTPAMAAKPGHGGVMSPSGAPLRVEIPLYDLTQDDLSVLKASIAPQQSWLAAGLTSPAALETLSVSIEPGFTPGSRRLVVRSSQTVNRPIVDVLLDVALATGRLTVQSSYLVLVSSAPAGSVVIVPGDTLASIAQRYAVAGADLYQMLWALYQANPSAFISQNMNLLRAGTTLSIPDAQTVLAIDAKFAYGMFLKHVEAFKQGRGTANRPSQTPLVAPASTNAGSVATPAPAAEQAPVGDQLRLSGSSQSSAADDAKLAAAQELKEMQDRIEALQKNLQQLRDAVAHTGQAAQTGQSGPTGQAGQTGQTGQTGQVGPATRPVLTGMARVEQVANDNVLWVVLGASAALALLMAYMLRRAGTRETAQGAKDNTDPAMSQAFDQKLQSIDLNLDTVATEVKPITSSDRKS